MARGRPPKNKENQMDSEHIETEVSEEAKAPFGIEFVDPDPEAEEVVFAEVDPVVEEAPIANANIDRITALIGHLKGKGLDVAFDDHGVTFKRGHFVEFINYSSSDRLIVNAATRIAG